MALARWQATIMDESGEAQPSAQVTVTTEGGGLAQLYSDRDGLTPIGNPITADSEGFVFFHVTGGAYRIDATLGAFTRTWRYVGISTSSEHDFSEVGDPSELFFNAVEHGWLGDGNDHSVEALALLNTVNNAGGGEQYISRPAPAPIVLTRNCSFRTTAPPRSRCRKASSLWGLGEDRTGTR